MIKVNQLNYQLMIKVVQLNYQLMINVPGTPIWQHSIQIKFHG